MKKRYIYALLFGVPGFFVSLIVSTIVFGGAAGIFWIFIFGDDPWPAYAEKLLSILLILGFLALWTASIVIGYKTGEDREDEPDLDSKHIVISAAAIFGLVIVIVLHQYLIGNIGPKDDGRLCSEFCSEKGYSASGMPPRDSGESSCSCYDNDGKEGMKVMMDSIKPDKKEGS
ncbi:MAG: hypothetical protein HY807_00380 [Nitrospirae bacterium]|nr:hypothetical protein [Nitrospirota bacterium]